MATLIVKTSDMTRCILDGGKMVGISGDVTVERMPEMHVDDLTWNNLTFAYGQPIID